MSVRQQWLPMVTGESGDSLQHLQGYTGTEAHLSGISPTFWAHVPLYICQIHDLILLEEGINCLLIATCNEEVLDDHEVEPTAQFTSISRAIPVSKCKFLGTVVYAERKANGCVTYVIDDGTGLMDCLHWDTEHDDYDGLPSLTGHQTSDCLGVLIPGTVVQVWGRIQCVSVGDCLVKIALRAVGEASAATTTSTRKCRRYESVVREIHASIVEPVQASSRATPYSMDSERRHWIDCVQTQSRVTECDTTLLSRTLLNPLDILQKLGPDIGEQIADRSNLPSANDECGLWRLFGVHCRCTNALIQNELLYCHCIATSEVLDTNFVYRDSLLETLLGAERTTMEATLSAQASNPSETNDPGDNDVDNNNNSNPDDQPGLFRFQYNAIAHHNDLNVIAAEQIQHWKDNQSKQYSHHSGHIQQLIRATFRALCKDGILYLLDPDQDTYIFISRTGVLEPYVQQSLACETAADRTLFYATRPPYLRAVPRSRMQLLRRLLTNAATTTNAS